MNGSSLVPVLLNPTKCASLLRSYTRWRSLRSSKHLHAILISSGILHRHPLLLSALTAAYSLCGHLFYAHQLFDEIPLKSTFLFNVLIRSSVDAGVPNDALILFTRLLSSPHRTNSFTFPFVLKACGNLSLLTTGAQIHCKIMIEGFSSDEYVQNCLIAMYMNCHRTRTAASVFDQISCKSAVAWNTLISGFLQNGFADEAMLAFERMVSSGTLMDQATALSVLPACAQLMDLQSCRRVHKLVEEHNLDSHSPVKNALIDMYAKCGSMDTARRLFDEANLEKDVVCWTTMIAGYVFNGYPAEALVLSLEMMSADVMPNSMTISSLLTACGCLSLVFHGMCIHGLCIKIGLESAAFVETALIDMYSKSGDMNLSMRVFKSCSKGAATWNAIISGFVRIGPAWEATELFKLMLREGMVPDLITLRSLLPVYSWTADLQQTNNIHCYLLKTGFLVNIDVTTCLIDAYAKVGCLDIASELFDNLPYKDLVVWSTIINGYGTHGHAEKAICLFDQMLESGVVPNEVTFTSILYTCSHSGLVDQGLRLLVQMMTIYGMKPSVDHCVCVVDLLGRAGRLEEAHKLIKEMHFEDNYAVWGAMLGACVIHENVELGEMAARRLFKMQPENTGNYVLLGNIYSAIGRWKDGEAVRRVVVERRLRKEVGCSYIDM